MRRGGRQLRLVQSGLGSQAGLIAPVGLSLPFTELFNDHGGQDRNGDAYPPADPRYDYEVGSGSQALVRAATGDIIHNQAGFDNVHLLVTHPQLAISGGAQYVEATVANLGSGAEIPEIYVRHGLGGGTGLWLSTSTLQGFDWNGSAANGIPGANASVSLSVNGPHTFGLYVSEDGEIEGGVLGLGRLFGPLSHASIRATGGHGWGWYRPAGTGEIPMLSLTFATTKPAWLN